jgi:hypothetical protein
MILNFLIVALVILSLTIHEQPNAKPLHQQQNVGHHK